MDKVTKTASPEQLAEYEALRNSIISCENKISNETIYMYIAYFALAAFGFEQIWVLFLSYLVLIVFQTMVNEDRVNIERTSTYIRVFFEDRYDIHWEHLNADGKHMDVFRKYYRTIGWYITKFGPSILAFLSTICIVRILLNKDNSSTISVTIAQLMIAILLFHTVLYLNRKYYENNKRKLSANHTEQDHAGKQNNAGKQDNELEQSIRKFYSDRYEVKDDIVGNPQHSENDETGSK